MKFDNKLLLIAPTIVLGFIVAGLVYASMQLRMLTVGSDSLKERSDFIASVERQERTINAPQAVALIRLSLDVEARRTAAVGAARDLLLALAAMTAVCCVVLSIGIRGVPREHWPRFNFGASRSQSGPSPP
jgi:hypothetical protein